MSKQAKLVKAKVVYRCLRCASEFPGGQRNEPPRKCPGCDQPIVSNMISARKVYPGAEVTKETR